MNPGAGSATSSEYDTDPNNIVIVGAGECGTRTALNLREGGFQGTVTLIGNEGMPAYERPPLSKATLTELGEPQPVLICDATALDSLHIDFVSDDCAVAISPDTRTVSLAGGTTHTYDRLILATGASARILSVSGGEHAYTLRTFRDAQRLQPLLQSGTKLVVIGGGFIGLEVAASAVARGCSVSVVEFAPRLMGRAVPEPIAAIAETRHRELGVTIRLGVGVASIEPLSARGLTVNLADGTTLEADVVVAGVGSVAETSLAEHAGLHVDNGIVVNEFLATSDASIFAAGDCVSFPHQLYDNRLLRLEAWRNALDQAALVANNVLGPPEPYLAVPWFWSDQHDLSLQVAGIPSFAHHDVARTRSDGSEILFGLSENNRIVSAAGIGRGNAVAKEVRLAEMLISKRTIVDSSVLADPSFNLKSLLAS
jgi:3-phenylpropionate/trans-cinnamate dioxygenase ferredoxin reductase component